MNKITPEQIHFFETFGYIALPGLLADSIDWITEEFETIFTDQSVIHDGAQRSCILPFADRGERLCTILDDPRIEGLAASLLDDDFNFLCSDGNYYTGDTPWHSDGFHTVGKFIKIAFYLDPVKADTGALRVIPGSHRVANQGNWDALKASQARELWGIEQSEVPSVTLETRPGDIVAFNHNIMHASFGGNSRRRMFTLNLSSHAETPEEIDDLKGFISFLGRFWTDHSHADMIKDTASPQRMIHLQQVIDNEGHLPAIAAKARQEMFEPSRGS